MKPYYEDSMVTIYHGDCRAILYTLNNVDLVIADPPYGMNKAEWDKFINPQEWLNRCREISPAVLVFCGVRALFDYPRPDWTICWERLASTQRSGEFKGFNNWEPILLYRRGSITIPNDTISVPNTEHETGHPTQKPMRLIAKCISFFNAQVILDPFMGSGTTLRAAKDFGVASIGIDQDEKWCECAAKRMSQQVFQFSS